MIGIPPWLVSPLITILFVSYFSFQGLLRSLRIRVLTACLASSHLGSYRAQRLARASLSYVGVRTRGPRRIGPQGSRQGPSVYKAKSSKGSGFLCPPVQGALSSSMQAKCCVKRSFRRFSQVRPGCLPLQYKGGKSLPFPVVPLSSSRSNPRSKRGASWLAGLVGLSVGSPMGRELFPFPRIPLG